ncbi:MAG: substrate-binding domain-containing protein [Planktomarina sp.]|nr:substrate-binding domain-containing protein [Planktomarina sp.]|tara:strand:- start:2779 stop:3576 length:798 start_codon:yes stop_codon:yes gene_type:complete
MIRFIITFFMLFSIELRAETMRLAATTSFNNSGLSDVLLPAIRMDTGLDVQLVIVGTGQAIRLGEAGDVDAILVHSKAAEEAFVAAGFGTHRRNIMYNDFVLIGPRLDPAKISEAASALEALQLIFAAKENFVSRGDDSGTHKKELALWSAAILDSKSFGPWYKAVGAGMGASLNSASGLNSYIMADRASWANFGNKGTLALLFSGDPILLNQYAYIAVNSDLHSHVKIQAARRLEKWLLSARAKNIINNYKIKGQALFTFNGAP